MEEAPPAKRKRLESGQDNLFDEARRKNATDLLDLATDNTSNLEAKIHMISPCLGGTHQLNLEISEHGDNTAFWSP
ncbi:hypothetical protein AZE42_06280 [Rhizopogon vesiculosus]|uniref:Uncharacterized protein n=1 Tax=Rhizopogon vesiculosus TaxID=180088 RepID=A0A1J8Q1J8_9AGAM|nr:hypothetical protein AZE42_06280 [Rhizopogon vesiculosus]